MQRPDPPPGAAHTQRQGLPVEAYAHYLRLRRQRDEAMARQPPPAATYVKDVILRALDGTAGGSGRWTVEGPLIRGRDSWIFKARTPLATFPLAVKVYGSATPAERVVKRYRQLERYHGTMAGGNATVATPWAVLPEHRTLISEWIDEPLLGTLLRQAGRQRRAELFRAAGQWLRRFHEQAGIDFRPLDAVRLQWHVDRSLGAVPGAGHGVGDAVFRHGYALLVRHADAFAQTPVGHTTCHGDFTPTNLFHGPARTVGIDFGASTGLPVSFDICRFLVYAETSKPFAVRKAELSSQGIARLDQEAFMAGYGRLEQPLEGRVLSYLHLAEILRRWAMLIGQQPGSCLSVSHWMRLVRLRRMAWYAAHHLERAEH